MTCQRGAGHLCVGAEGSAVCSPEKGCLYYAEEAIMFLSSGAEEISFIHSPLVLGEGAVSFSFQDFFYLITPPSLRIMTSLGSLTYCGQGQKSGLFLHFSELINFVRW